MATVYQIVTDQIISQLEAGVAPWRKPWVTSAPKNLISGKEYRGLNTFMLSASGFPRPEWLTFKQAEKLGGKLVVAPRDIPEVGRFAVIQDPQGATIAIITYAKKQ